MYLHFVDIYGKLVGNFFPDPLDPSFHSVRKKTEPEFYSVTIFLPYLPSQKLTEPLNNGGWETAFLGKPYFHVLC